MEKYNLFPFDEDEDDLYSGFNEFHPTLNTSILIPDSLNKDVKNQQSLQVTGKFYEMFSKDENAWFYPSLNQTRNITTSRGAISTAAARPVTAIRGAGYTSTRLSTANQAFDPLNQTGRVTTPFSESKASESYDWETTNFTYVRAIIFCYLFRPEKQIKILESAIQDIIEESIIAQSKEEFRLALDKAKEAVNKERNLLRQKEQFAIPESNNDLAFIVRLPFDRLKLNLVYDLCIIQRFLRYLGHVQSC